MPDEFRTKVFFEGDDDKAVLEKLQKAGLLPSGWELAKRDKNEAAGKAGLLKQLVPLVSPQIAAGRAVVLLDLDQHSTSEAFQDFECRLRGLIPSDVSITRGQERGAVCEFLLKGEVRIGLVVLIVVGRPNDPLLKNYGIDHFAMDDWILPLTLNQKIHEANSDLERVPFEIVEKKYREVAGLFRSNGLEVCKAKTYLQILRAVAAIGPSSATIFGRIVEKAIGVLGLEAFVSEWKPLLDDFQTASRIVSGESRR